MLASDLPEWSERMEPGRGWREEYSRWTSAALLRPDAIDVLQGQKEEPMRTELASSQMLVRRLGFILSTVEAVDTRLLDKSAGWPVTFELQINHG